jgi:hypothetical protein
MRTKTRQLFKQKLQNLPAINTQEDLDHVLIQYCREMVHFFGIDICSVLIPESNTFLKALLLKVSTQEETSFDYIFISKAHLPWKYRTGRKNPASNNNILILSDMEEDHPYKNPIQYFLKCSLRAMVVVPLYLNNVALGYILLINEKTPRIFTNEEIDLLQESADYFSAAIKKTISHEQDRLSAKIISEIEGYKTFLKQKGARKNPAVIVQIFQQSGIQVRRIFLFNKDPHLGKMWYHAVINASGATEVNEMGTISESGFDFFINELVINDRRLIGVPIKTGNTQKGKLAIKYSQIENDRAVLDHMLRVLETIAPQLAELMYL